MYSSSTQFNHKKVVDISTEMNRLDLTAISPMLRVDPEADKTFADHFEHFLAHQDAATLDTLVIGFWAEDYDLSDTRYLSRMLAVLIDHKDKLPALKALFIGNIAQEESEISWIEMVCLSPIISAFSLENFRARGNGRFLEAPINNTGLKKLSLETGGLSAETIKHIIASDLPNLEHLELWIGDSEWYGDAKFAAIQPLLNSNKFPNLQYLGLRNCNYADELAIALANGAEILTTVKTLDLSLGNLSNKGAKALATSVNIASLDKLDIHYHYIEDDALLATLATVVPELDASDQQEADIYEDDGEEEISRYVFVSE
ncbi:MAG TPA: hypothetical protein ENJ33_07105 [Thiothrix sp.]|nr:hypothetical protein [Thiothrix sp.]